ncbi:MAG: hypothetical protein GY821_10365 [Gammaproteobacteria bacterium]|nr:hypothetical protein [Gammaproteobacteria bacterium]
MSLNKKESANSDQQSKHSALMEYSKKDLVEHLLLVDDNVQTLQKENDNIRGIYQKREEKLTKQKNTAILKQQQAEQKLLGIESAYQHKITKLKDNYQNIIQNKDKEIYRLNNENIQFKSNNKDLQKNLSSYRRSNSQYEQDREKYDQVHKNKINAIKVKLEAKSSQITQLKEETSRLQSLNTALNDKLTISSGNNIKLQQNYKNQIIQLNSQLEKTKIIAMQYYQTLLKHQPIIQQHYFLNSNHNRNVNVNVSTNTNINPQQTIGNKRQYQQTFPANMNRRERALSSLKCDNPTQFSSACFSKIFSR